MRHGALPATMAAPMTSSEDLPAGICSAVTFWSGFAVFQAATTCSPQATSCSLLEYQILIGPTAVRASPHPVLPPLHPPHAASVKVMARPTARYPSGRVMVFLPPGLWCSELRGARGASRGLCGDGVVEPLEAVRWAEGRHAWAAAAEVTGASDGARGSSGPVGAGSIGICLLYTSPSPRDGLLSRMPSSA